MCILAIIGACAPAGAHDGVERQREPRIEVFSEYEAFVNALQEEDGGRGRSESARRALAEYENTIAKRAKLPDETLRKYGYTAEQIALLKAYDAGVLRFAEIAADTSATLTTWLTCSVHTTTEYTITYEWCWNILPAYAGDASVALTYDGITGSSSGLEPLLSSYRSRVNYFYVDRGYFYQTETGSLGLIGKCFSTEFPSQKRNSEDRAYVWPKTGTLTVTIAPAVSGGNTFAAVRADAAYGQAMDSGASPSLVVDIFFGFRPVTFASPSASVTYGRKQTIFYNDGSSIEVF